MSRYWYIDSVLIFIGTVTLLASFFVASRIIAELGGTGKVRRPWIYLRLLICLFVLGYIGYWINLPHDTGHNGMIVSFIFFFGAVFVLAICWLMLQTTRDIKMVTRLEFESITDPLIGIYNRRYLDERLSEEIFRAQRYNLQLSLLMLDIDHFKNVNDRYGHLVGDNVLVIMGKTLRDSIRKSDIAARFGGEELVLVLPNTAEANAVVLAERLRIILEQTRYSSNNTDTTDKTEDSWFSCTVSIGAASLGEENCTPAELLHKADEALYEAKRTGRNKVVAYRRK